MKKQGNIQISSENMMPIIKKWLYSDKDIFLREIVANGVDAITKHKKLVEMGEAQADENGYKITVTVDEKAKTVCIEDNGIGMTAEEVEKYITQIAFSGASDFLAKYEKTSGDGIIGHFGLGFYSAYMVSDLVEIYTKSYKDEPAVKWQSDGDKTYEMEETDKPDRGTKIVLHIQKDEKEFTKESTIRALLQKYCSFMPYDVYLNPTGDKEKDKPVNTTTPLYLKDPKSCTDEEYKEFYQKTFHDFNEPLFWIHLNMEYPFRLKGVLYFPQVKKRQMQLEKGEVKLYCNQVFIADNIKEVIPEFLMLLNGVIDCPDIPLNVSRSFLQNDKEVQKISKHITKKVADKLLSLYKNDREKYENCWRDLSTFVKFGCIKDESFYEKVQDLLLYKDLSGKYVSITSAFGEEISDEDAEKGVLPKVLYYVSDEKAQAHYVSLFKDAGLNAYIANEYVDPHFLSFIEYKNPKKCRFVRIDADVDGALKVEKETDETLKNAVLSAFEQVLKDRGVAVKVENLANTATTAVLTVDEFMRRMSEMNGFYGMDETDTLKNATLVVNLNNDTMRAIPSLDDEKRTFIVEQTYLLALSSYQTLSPEDLQKFVAGMQTLLSHYAK